MRKFYQVWSVNGLETTRTARDVAVSDVEIFAWLGRNAWIEEIER